MRTRERKRRGVRRIAALVAVLAIIALAAVLLVVFRINTLQLLGNSRYSAEQIEKDLIYDFATENTLWFSWKYKHAVAEPRAPYLASVQAKMLSPGTVRLTVTEKELNGYIQYEGSNVFFDSEGLVLEISDQVYEGAVLVTGVPSQEPILYQKLPVENTALLRTVLSITGLIRESGLSVDSVSFDDNLSITANMGSVEVQLGQDEYLKEKVANLVTIYPKVASQTGTLNMTAFTGKNAPITFNPQEETEPPVQETPDQTEEGYDSSGQEEGGEAGADEWDDGSGEIPAEDGGETPEDASAGETYGLSAFMVFDSSGTLRYDAHVVNGIVVDAYGNEIPGCSVNERGNVIDAYWNEIDTMTGTLAE